MYLRSHAVFAACLLSFLGKTGEMGSTSGQQACPGKTKVLNVIAMAPFPNPIASLNPSWGGGPAVIPGTQVAIDHINGNCTILSEYRLNLTVVDSGCNLVTKATVSFVRAVFYETSSPVVGIIGPGCSAATVTIGNLLRREDINLLHIAPSATSPLLTNVTEYPNTFRPIASSLGFVDGYSFLIQNMTYSSVAIFYESTRFIHTQTSLHFEQMLKNRHVKYDIYAINEHSIPLNNIEYKQKIIFVFGSTTVARNMMCLAHHLDILYPNYQFIFSERRLANFMSEVNITHNGTPYYCSMDVMNKSIVGIILNQIRLTRKDNIPIVSGINYDSFLEQYKIALMKFKEELNISKEPDTEHESGYYDSTWALAISLNRSIQKLKDHLNITLDDYSLGHPNVTDIVRNELLSNDNKFEGTRGTVQFSKLTHDAQNFTVIDIFQIQESGINDGVQVRLVGTYESSKLEIINASAFIKDQFDLDYVSPPFYIRILVLLAIILVGSITVIFHILNSLWITEKSMKVTSPALNHVIFSGCYVYLLSILLSTLQFLIDNKNPVLYGVSCSFFIWCESIGLTLIFGTISIKSWRTFKIFSHKSASVIDNLQNHHLMIYVIALLMMDFLYNVVWNSVNPWFLNIVNQDELRTGVACNCENVIYWSVFLLLQKGLLIISVFYLSILTRRIPRKEFKQTKSTNTLVYILTFIYCFTVPIYIILQGSTNVYIVTFTYLVFCFKNISSVVLCAALIFLPPILPILKERRRDWHSVVSNNTIG